MIIIRSAQLPANIPPKPKDFLGSDAEWAALNNQDTDQNSVPDWQDQEEQKVEVPQTQAPSVDQLLTPPKPEVQPEPQPAIPQPSVPALVPETVPEVQPVPETPDQMQVPDWLGEEETFQPEQPKPIPEPDQSDIPTGVSRQDIPDEYKQVKDDFEKISPREENEPVDPAAMFEEVLPKDTPLDEQNKTLSVKQKIWQALNKGGKLTVNYDTLEKNGRPSVNINRTVDPQYVAFNNRTNRFLLFTQPDENNPGAYGPSEGDGWKSFAIDNIREAKLEE